MYKIEKYLIDCGYKKEAEYPAGSIIYTNEEDTYVMLLPKREEWEISSSGPYLIAVGKAEPEVGYARLQAAAVKNYIEEYMYKLREALLDINDPWAIV